MNFPRLTSRQNKLVILLFLIIISLVVLYVPVLKLEQEMKRVLDDSFDYRYMSMMQMVNPMLGSNDPISIEELGAQLINRLTLDNKLWGFVIADADATPLFLHRFKRAKSSIDPGWQPEIRMLRQGLTFRSDYQKYPGGERSLWLCYPAHDPISNELTYIVGFEVDAHQLWVIEKNLLILSFIRMLALGSIIWGIVVFVLMVISPNKKLASLAATVRPGLKAKNLNMEHVISTFSGVIDELHQKEDKLKQLHASAKKRADSAEIYTQDILQSITSGVLTFNPTGKLLVHNAAALRILRHKALSSTDHTWGDFFGTTGELADLISRTFETKTMFQGQELMWQPPTAPDESLWIGISSSLLRNSEDDVEGFTFLFADLTETKQLQRRLEQERHLASLGEMSAGIAHEFRNSLGVILGFAQLLQKTSAQSDNEQQIADGILKEIHASKEMITSFLNFARPPKMQRSPIIINDVMDNLVVANASTAAEIETSFASNIPPIDGDELMIKSVFQNIIQNGLQAMGTSGKLTLQTKLLERSQVVQVTISDSGEGIDDEHLVKVITPFFTTRTDGTGLGLAIAQRNINAHGGELRINSTAGVGTTVTVTLPLS